MPNQGFKQRTFRFSDDKFERLKALIKANECDNVSEFLSKIVEQDLLVVKNFSKKT